MSLHEAKLRQNIRRMSMKTAKVKHRVTWGFNPVTRTIASKKCYSRAKNKREIKQSIQEG